MTQHNLTRTFVDKNEPVFARVFARGSVGLWVLWVGSRSRLLESKRSVASWEAWRRMAHGRVRVGEDQKVEKTSSKS